MSSISAVAEQILLQFSTAFTQPTFNRVFSLSVRAILTGGR